MLNEDRIKEAKTNMNSYIIDNLITKQPFKQIIFDTYIRNHNESLNLAEHIHNNKLSNLWAIVVSYYSMYYIAKAVLYKMGYKIGTKLSHKITADALIELARNELKQSLLEDYETIKNEALEIAGIKADNIIESFDKERAKRSIMQYETTEEIKYNKAQTSFQRAKEFSLEMHKLLERI